MSIGNREGGRAGRKRDGTQGYIFTKPEQTSQKRQKLLFLQMQTKTERGVVLQQVSKLTSVPAAKDRRGRGGGTNRLIVVLF